MMENAEVSSKLHGIQKQVVTLSTGVRCKHLTVQRSVVYKAEFRGQK